MHVETKMLCGVVLYNDVSARLAFFACAFICEYRALFLATLFLLLLLHLLLLVLPVLLLLLSDFLLPLPSLAPVAPLPHSAIPPHLNDHDFHSFQETRLARPPTDIGTAHTHKHSVGQLSDASAHKHSPSRNHERMPFSSARGWNALLNKVHK